MLILYEKKENLYFCYMDIITEFIKILELKRYSKQTISNYARYL